VRDRLLTACQQLIDADDELASYRYPPFKSQKALKAFELVRQAVRDFTLAGERRESR
jgi:hypothetical protein